MLATSRLRSSLLFGLSLAALLFVIAMVWAMLLEERRTRTMGLQFELYRASASLAEAWLDNPAGNLVGGPVIGFGVYDAQGRPIVSQGSAPSHIDPSPRRFIALSWGPGRASVRLMRPLPGGNDRSRGFGSSGPPGPGAPGFGMMGGGAENGMMGAGQGRGMMGDTPGGGMMGLPPFGGVPPQGPLDLAFAGPRTMWLEYSVSARSLGEALLTTGGVALSLILIAIYAFVLILIRRNGELREREVKIREFAELGQAARTLVHEIKNPLGIIGIQAAMLRRRDGGDSKTGKSAIIIDGEVRRLAGMADRIREFLKAGPGDVKAVELREFLRAFVARHDVGGEAGDGSVELELPSAETGPAPVRIDPDRLSLALDNLLANAREADPDGCPSIALARRGRLWMVVVSDRGVGVNPESRDRLFEPFFTTKEKGSGIGLALARSVARAAGGDLGYAPRPGGGSQFSLSLPISG